MSDTPVKFCGHIKTSGGRCGSPAMRGMDYCFYHLGARQSLPVPHGMFVESSPKLPDASPMHDFPIPFLDDPGGLQIGYMQALYGITSKRLHPRQARLVLDALNGASRNLRRMEALLSTCDKGKAQTGTKAGAKKPAAAVKRAPSRSGKRAARA